VTTVAVYGSVNWDEICRLPRYPGEHEKIDALAIDSALGGSAANTATWLVGRVDRVELIGAVGDDPEGRLCLDWLDVTGVGHNGVETIAGARTSRACSWVVGSDKRIVTFRQPALRREHAPETALEILVGADHLHLGSTIDAAGFDCLTSARDAGLSISVELSGNTHDTVRPHADIVFLNTEELQSNFGLIPAELTPEAVARVAPKPGATLVITHGPHGIVCAAGGSVQRFPVTALENVVDRTGGGDAFDAGFIAGWLPGRDLAQAVAAGLDSSSRVLQQVGGARRPRH
jgi:ribokinase